MKTTKIIETTLKKDIFLKHYDISCVDPDYALREIKVETGEKCLVQINKHTDGRVYYHYFKIVTTKQNNKVVYHYPVMRKGTRVELNCGGLYTADEEKLIELYG